MDSYQKALIEPDLKYVDGGPPLTATEAMIKSTGGGGNLEDYQVVEWLKCRSSFYYWVMTYGTIQTASGENVLLSKSEYWDKPNSIYKLSAKMVDMHPMMILAGSRQCFKTTLQLLVIAHRLIFYASCKIAFVTIDKLRSLDAIVRIKQILDGVPDFMQVKNKSTSEKQTYIMLENESKVFTFSVSGSTDPASVARGISTYTIAVDESAFLRGMEEIMGSIGPAFSTASVAAKKFNLKPTFILSSTPNGKNNFFYGLVKNSTKIEDIYDYKLGRFKPNWYEIITGPEKNGYVEVVYHWKYNYDEEWYKDQCRLLNYNRAKIQQELDVVYLGSSSSIFDTETLDSLVIQEPIGVLKLLHGSKLTIYKPIPQEPIIIGVDTAGSNNVNSDYSAIVIINAMTKEVLGELKWKNAIIRRYREVIQNLSMVLKTEFNLPFSEQFYAIENNSFGKNLIEELIYDVDSGIPFDRMIIQTSKQIASLVEKNLETKPSKMGLKSMKKTMGSVEDTITWSYGINTNVKTREIMINLVLNEVNVAPHQIISKYLCEELSSLEQKANGKIESAGGSHDDLVMAYSFTLFGRRILIERNLLYVEGELLNGPSKESITSIVSLATNSILSSRSEVGLSEVYLDDTLTSSSEGNDLFFDPFGGSY